MKWPLPHAPTLWIIFIGNWIGPVMKEEERESLISAYRFQLLGCRKWYAYSSTECGQVSKSLNGCAYQICVTLKVYVPVLLELYYPGPFLNVLSSSG